MKISSLAFIDQTIITVEHAPNIIWFGIIPGRKIAVLGGTEWPTMTKVLKSWEEGLSDQMSFAQYLSEMFEVQIENRSMPGSAGARRSEPLPVEDATKVKYG